jgi:Arc/MetJ-type ribon-helix-helix transcriptional regulator
MYHDQRVVLCLPTELLRQVDEAVKCGHFSSRAEYIRDALRKRLGVL